MKLLHYNKYTSTKEKVKGLDKIFYNGVIHTFDKQNTITEAIGIKNNKIAFVGSNEEAEKIDAKERINLYKHLVLPGFIDTHMHVLEYALTESSIKLFDCTSIKEAIEKGKDFIRENNKELNWIIGRGWNQNKFTDERRFFTKADLDKISTEHPVIYCRVCCHAAVVNSLALSKILALEKSTELMEYIDVKTGILKEAAIYLYTSLLEGVPSEGIQELIIKAQADLNKAGITSVHSVDFGALPGNGWQDVITAYETLEKKEKLTVRTYEQCVLGDTVSFADFLEKGYVTGKGSALFKIGPLKLFADGSLGARTALMKEPYSDDLENYGLQVYDKTVLRELFEMADKHKMQLAVHCIGDKAIEMSVDLMNEVNNEHVGNPRRHGIVHAQITNTEILRKIQQGELLVYIQPVFVHSDMGIAEERIGRARMNKIYAWKSMRELGIRTSGSSDSPVESFNVLENIYYAVTRKNENGLPKGGWIPGEKLTVDEAVRLFTVEAAFASFEENEKGSLEAGKYADMVVLDKDIYEIAEDEIKGTRILCTVMDGEIVYKENASE